MNFRSALAAATTAAAAALAFGGASVASADPAVQWLGQPGELVNGGVVQHWTVSHLKPSTDTIPYTPVGTLWEATASDEAVSGDVTPIISNLNARATNGDTYRVLFGVATEQGVNPATLAQGQKTSGKIYFDVTGEAPDSVFYSSGADEELLWVQAPPAPSGGTGSTTASPSSSGASDAPVAAAESPQAAPAAGTPTAAEATPSQVPASSGTPLPEGSSGTPLPEGSSGTPLPEGSSGTPLPQNAVPHAPGVPTTTVVVPAPPA